MEMYLYFSNFILFSYNVISVFYYCIILLIYKYFQCLLELLVSSFQIKARNCDRL